MAKANHVFLLGSLCSDVDFRILPKSGVASAKYQMAITRDRGKGTDFPYVVSFGKQAESDAIHLRKSSQCLVRGRIQTREFRQPLTCPHCQESWEKESVATEVVADNVEYLNNCVFPENETSETPVESVSPQGSEE